MDARGTMIAPAASRASNAIFDGEPSGNVPL
jgi:hypothetical protein